MSKETDVVVVGAGPGGYAAAFMSADLGMKTMLVDKEENPGGVCLYRGCIPSKALLHAAKIISEAKEAEAIGLTFSDPTIDLNKLRDWKNDVIGRLTGGLGQLRKARKVEHVRGTATFLDANTLRLEGQSETIRFKYCILATGSRPVIPGPLQIGSERVMSSTEAHEQPENPQRMHEEDTSASNSAQCTPR